MQSLRVSARSAKNYFFFTAELGHYYGSLRNILSFLEDFVNETSGSNYNPFNYSDIVAGQLSNYEVVVLAYYLLTFKEDRLSKLAESFLILRPLQAIAELEKRKASKWIPVIIEPDLVLSRFPYLSAIEIKNARLAMSKVKNWLKNNQRYRND